MMGPSTSQGMPMPMGPEGFPPNFYQENQQFAGPDPQMGPMGPMGPGDEAGMNAEGPQGGEQNAEGRILCGGGGEG